jgi:hypothetical protein
MVAHPMKDGSHGGSQMTVKLANGTMMGGVPRPPVAAGAAAD